MKKAEKAHKALWQAVRDNDLEATKQHLVEGVDPDLLPFNALQDSILLGAIKQHVELPIIKLLLEHGASPDFKNASGRNAIDSANNCLRKDVIDLLEARGVDVKWVELEDLPQETKDARLTAVLGSWIDDNAPELTQRLVKAGANSMAIMHDKMPAPFELIRIGGANPELFTALLAPENCSVRHEGRTLLHAVSDHASNIDLATLLVQWGIDLDAQDNEGNTALHVAVQSATWSANTYIEWIIGAGANIAIKNNEGQTAFDLTSGKRKQILMTLSGQVLKGDAAALMAAAEKGDKKAVEELLQVGAAFHLIDPENSYSRGSMSGITALHLAFGDSDRYSVAELLLKQPSVDPNSRSLSGQTPLHILIDNGNGKRPALLKQLLAAGADVNLSDEYGRSPLFLLGSFYELTDEIEILDAMVEAGADVNLLAGRMTILDTVYSEQDTFHEINDGKGFCQYLERLVEHGAKSSAYSQEEVSAWLDKKFGHFLRGEKPDLADSPIRTTFESVVDGVLGEFRDEIVWLEIEGEYEPVALFDWFDLLDAREQDEGNDATAIEEYHVMGAPEEFVPIGVVGLSTRYFAESTADGTLFLAVQQADEYGDAPVVFLPNQSTVARLTENDSPRILELSFKNLIDTQEDSKPT